MPEQIKVGDRVRAIWFPEGVWYEGVVRADADGELYIITKDPNYPNLPEIGYLKDADEVILIEKGKEL